MEPLLNAIQARRHLAQLRGQKLIRPATLARMILEEGLPVHPCPFGSTRKVFLASEIESWLQKKLQTFNMLSRKPGRPRKDENRPKGGHR